MKILLLNPPDDLENVLGQGKQLVTPFEPLGILYIAAVLEQEGYEVHVVDSFIEQLSVRQAQKRIRDIRPDILGMTVFELLYDVSLGVARTASAL